MRQSENALKVNRQTCDLEQLRQEMLRKTDFIDQHGFLHGNDTMESLKDGFVFALFAEGRRTLINGREIETIRSSRKTPGRAAILEEKDQAVVLADKGLALLKEINLPADDPCRSFWKDAVILSRAVRELVVCMIAYFDDMEWEKADAPHLKAQIADTMAKFGRWKKEPLSGTILERLKSLENICGALATEFTAEFTAKNRFLTGCEDGVITGGLTDDWRIFRQQHTAHAVLCQGLPAYQITGFIELKLKRGEELVIYGVPEETGKFVLVCDGHRIHAGLNADGMFVLPLDCISGEVSVRLEKEGPDSPLFCAVVTRNRGWENRKKTPLFTSRDTVMPKDAVPEVIYDENPGLVELYYAAWQSAWMHIFTCRKAPVSPYMNEGIRCHKIWIWDSCFMAHFCRYAADVFPGIQTLDNFYRVMHDGENTGLKVHIPDNPPLFAWTEYEYFKHTGDTVRIRKILLEHRYLQRHYQWLNELKSGILFDYATSPTGAQFIPGKGFRWHGGKAGMDNTPRGDDDYSSIYYVDLSCQQALSALCIGRLAEAVGENELAQTWFAEYEKQKEFVNARFWSEADRMYLDRKVDESGFCQVLTPASMWPLLAEIAEPGQAEALAEVLRDPEKLGGERPLPSVSRDDPRFSPQGEYWRGGIWMPMVYMAVKGLEKNALQELADEIARKMIMQQYRTWRNFEPHTIWECYSPTEDRPATDKVNRYSRPDFCGWSALGPISLFIENLLGIREVNAPQKRIVWTPSSTKTSGIRNLKMGGKTFSLIAYPEQGWAEVEAAEDFTLCLNGRENPCHAGKNMIGLTE